MGPVRKCDNLICNDRSMKVKGANNAEKENNNSRNKRCYELSILQFLQVAYPLLLA